MVVAILILLLCSFSATAQPSDLQVVRTTAQQIVLSYNAPAGDDCILEVSKQSDFATIVNDVNSSLFVNANRDLSRTGTYVEGSFRTVVLGARTINQAVNGKRYSLSLQAATPYYVRISDCGGMATVTTSTTAPTWGPLTGDTFPSDPNKPGFYGYATTSLTDRAVEYVDHLTGTQVKPLTLPSDSFDKAGIQYGTFGTPSGASWTAPDKALASDTLYAATTGTEALFFPNGTTNGSNDFQYYLFRLHLRASITGAPAGDDRLLNVCLGTTAGCLSNTKQIDLTTCSMNAEQGECLNFGNTVPLDRFWGEFSFPCITTTQQGGSCPTLNATASGVLVWKQTDNSSHEVRIDSARNSYQRLTMHGADTSGPYQCSYSTLNETGDSRQWQICYIADQRGHTARAFAIEKDTGEAHFLGFLYARVGGVDWGRNEALWDNNNPRFFYLIHGLSNPTRNHIYKCTWSSQAGTFTSDWTQGSAFPSKYSCGNITPDPYSLNQQIIAFDPAFSANWQARAFNWGVAAVTGGNKIALYSAVPQDIGQWIAVFDPDAAPPTGCSGCVGGVVASRPIGAATSPQYQKFCSNHGLNQLFGPASTWMGINPGRMNSNAGTTPWNGPWTISISPGSAFNVFNQLSQNGSYDAVDPTPSSVDPDQNAIPIEVGDLFIGKGSGTDIEPEANDEIFEISSIDRENHTITFLRGQNLVNSPWFDNRFTLYQPSTLNITGPRSLYAMCRMNSMTDTRKSQVIWNWAADPYGKNVTLPGATGPNRILRNNFGNHSSRIFDIQIHADSGTNNCGANVACYALQEGGTENVMNSKVTRKVRNTGTFAGKGGAGPAVNSHVQRTQFGASGRLRNYAMDVLPFNGGSGTIALVAGQSATWRVTGYNLNRKHFATTAFMSGFVLRDISGPESIIDDTKPGTFCVALLNAECRPDSISGNIYAALDPAWGPPVNCATGLDDARKVCISDAKAFAYVPQQVGLEQSDYVGAGMRPLVYHATRPYQHGLFQVAYPLHTGKWVAYFGHDMFAPQWYLAKVEMPVPSSRNVLTFDRIAFDLSPPENTASMRVQFGYAENGLPSEYRCTSRLEACAVDSLVVNESDPFKWASETPGWIPCSGGRCKAEIPRIPGRVLFSRVFFRNAGGTVIETRILPAM